MRSGSVGINLTSANYVFILEPALNPALEEQAVGRAWRMGQQREVTVKKFFVKVSIHVMFNSLALKGQYCNYLSSILLSKLAQSASLIAVTVLGLLTPLMSFLHPFIYSSVI